MRRLRLRMLTQWRCHCSLFTPSKHVYKAYLPGGIITISITGVDPEKLRLLRLRKTSDVIQTGNFACHNIYLETERLKLCPLRMPTVHTLDIKEILSASSILKLRVNLEESRNICSDILGFTHVQPNLPSITPSIPNLINTNET